ncbi:hypothetical protein DL95DRAFT_518352 [Leptodontidium sp. 2 PMI_412]|nr:hypothetical protein DL95DRAFT_518352 [Leptodontidium sp. 2 PMI_412]
MFWQPHFDASSVKIGLSPTSTAGAITGAAAGPPSFSDPLTIVTIIIGRSVSKIFAIYKEFACYYSPVLRAAFNGPFLEGQSQTMIIDDFSLSGAFGRKAVFALSGYCRIWVLADRLLMPTLQNHVAAEIIKHPNTSKISTIDISWTYDNTAPDSMLRKLLVDICAFGRMDAARLQDGKEDEFPPRFLLDVALALREDRETASKVHQETSTVVTKKLKLEDYKVLEPGFTA